MAHRRPRLPLILGLAVLTVAAYLLTGAGHLVLHAVMGIPMDPAQWGVALLLVLAPLASVALMLNGRPRHGAFLLSFLMLVAATWLLYEHFLVGGADHVPTLREGLGGTLYAGVLQMHLAFELQGFAAGAILAFRPQVPRAAEPATA